MEERTTHTVIHISWGSIARVILAIGGIFLLFYLRDLVLVVLAAIVIASSIEPAIAWTDSKRIPRLLSTTCIYAILALFCASIIYFVIPPLLSDTATFLAGLPKVPATQNINATEFLGFKNALQGIVSGASLADIVSTLSSLAADISKQSFQTISSVFGGLLSLFLIVVLSFYLSAQRDGVSNFLRLITPIKSEEYVIGLWKRSQAKIGLWMQGQLLLAVIVGILVYLGLTVLDVRYALLLAFFSAVFELIPVFGPILGAIPGVAISMIDGGVTRGFIIAGLYIIIQQFESNLIYPLVVKKVVGVPPLVVILALIAGLQLAGVLGAILAVPIAAALVEFLDDVTRDKNGVNKIRTNI